MSKYVLELRPNCRMVQQICESDGIIYVCSTGVRYLEELNLDYINEHYGQLQDDAYERGHGIGYQKGFEDGKAVHEKGCEGCEWEGTPFDACERCCNNYKNMWQAKSDKIEVGDEVEWTGDKCIVTYINYDIDTSEITDYDLLCDDGSVADHVKKCSFTKTGRHFDIQKILEEMRHD